MFPPIIWFSIVLLFILFIAVLMILLSKPQRLLIPGRYIVLDAEKSCPSLATCFYQNPDTPYARAVIPDDNLSDYDLFFGAFTLSPTEALVLKGNIQKEVGYWSFAPYVWREAGSLPPSEEDISSVRFASVADPINIFNTWVQDEFAIIATRNRIVFTLEEEYIATSGFTGPVIPIYFPDASNVDDILTLIGRNTLFANDAARLAYIANPQIAAYKIRYADVAYVPVPISLPNENLKPGGIKLKELPLNDSEIYLTEEFERYVVSVLEENPEFMLSEGGVEYPLRPFLSQVLGIPWNNGYQCLANQLNCQGDNRDTYYGVSDSFEVEAGDKFLAVAVNHRYTGRAYYASLSVYQDEIQFGLDSIIPESNAKYYSHIWTFEEPGIYRLTERAYTQLPEAIGPDARTILPAQGFLVRGGNF